jgi:hypothetical protein
MAEEIEITVTRGKTFECGMLYAESRMLYATLSAISNVAPVRVTATGHGIPDGWPVTVSGIKAPAELNTAADAPLVVTVVDADTLEFNELNAATWRGLSGTGVIAFRAPFDLTGCQARAQVRSKVGGDLLFSWHSDAGQVPDGVIELSVVTSQIILKMTAAVTAALTWSKGVFDVELITPGGSVLPVTGISKISVAGEVTV